MNSRQQYRALLLANLAAALGLNLLMFCMNEGHSRDFAERNAGLSSGIAEPGERLARIESLLQHIVPRPADPPDAGL